MTRFTIRLEILAVVPGKKLSAVDANRIKESVTIPKAKFIQTPAMVQIDIAKAQEPTPPIEPAALLRDYKDLQQKAADLRKFLNARVGQELNMKLDPVNQPEVWEAAHKLFKGNFNEVSYAAYLVTLKYMEELGRELGASLAT